MSAPVTDLPPLPDSGKNPSTQGPPSTQSSPSAQSHSTTQNSPVDARHYVESRALLAALVESSHDAIIGLNTHGIITSWNPAAERSFGFTAHEAVGRHISLTAEPGREAEMLRILGRVLSGERVDHYETGRRHKDGRGVLVSLTISPIRDHDGIIIGASKIARDITARKQSDRILQQTEKLAMLGRLSASIAHEINNPLEAVTNLLYLLRGCPLSSEGHDYLRMAENELARISNIVTQTLAFHTQNAPPHPVNLTRVTDSALRFLRHRTQSCLVRIERRDRPADPVLCLEAEIRQVLLHLLSNALEALGDRETHPASVPDSTDGVIPPARLILAHRPATDWSTGRAGIRLTIADNGPGIRAEALPRVFEAFFTTKGNLGNGLGLWISSEIITRHQGRIRVRSSQTPDHCGTVFSIFLPFSSPEISSESPAAPIPKIP